MSDEEGGSAAGAASQMAAVVTASLMPIGCAYGCIVGLLWLLGGVIVGLLLTLASRGIHLN